MIEALIVLIAIGVVIYSIVKTVKEFRYKPKTKKNVFLFIVKLVGNIVLVLFFLIGLVIIAISGGGSKE